MTSFYLTRTNNQNNITLLLKDLDYLGEQPKINVTKSGRSQKDWGWRISAKNKKVGNSKCRLFWKGGGGSDFQDFGSTDCFGGIFRKGVPLAPIQGKPNYIEVLLL